MGHVEVDADRLALGIWDLAGACFRGLRDLKTGRVLCRHWSARSWAMLGAPVGRARRCWFWDPLWALQL
jgi:hypothetical protein